MKKIFLSIAAVIFVFCFTFVAISGFAGAADMDKGMMMENGKMMMENGQMMMDKGQMMMDKGMKEDGEMMMKDGKKMMKAWQEDDEENRDGRRQDDGKEGNEIADRYFSY